MWVGGKKMKKQTKTAIRKIKREKRKKMKRANCRKIKGEYKEKCIGVESAGTGRRWKELNKNVEQRVQREIPAVRQTGNDMEKRRAEPESSLRAAPACRRQSR